MATEPDKLPQAAVVAVFDTKGAAESAVAEALQGCAPGRYLKRSYGALAWASLAEGVGAPRMESDRGVVALLLGHLVCEETEPEEALSWAVQVAREGRWADLARLQGTFVLLVLETMRQRITVISDLLSVRPFFLRHVGSATVFSDRAGCCARVGGARVDPLGMAAWAMFHTALADRSLYESVERLPPASALARDAHAEEQATYWRPPESGEDLSVCPTEGLLFGLQASLTRLLAPHDSALVLLSGGYDSRLILLLLQRQGRIHLEAVTVCYNQWEKRIATALAKSLAIPCKRVEVSGSIWDQYADMWVDHPDGYPLSKNLTYLGVVRLPGSGPFVSGTLAGASCRCPAANRLRAAPADLVEACEWVWEHRLRAPEAIFQAHWCRRLHYLAREAVREQARRIGWSPRFVLEWNLYTHERRYISINFIQHQHLAECLNPFVDRALIERRFRLPLRAFTKDQLRRLLDSEFPDQAGLPHADDLPSSGDTIRRFSWALWGQLPEIMGFLRRHRAALRMKWILPRLGAYAVGDKRQVYLVKALARFARLEQSMHRQGVQLDFAEALG